MIRSVDDEDPIEGPDSISGPELGDGSDSDPLTSDPFTPTHEPIPDLDPSASASPSDLPGDFPDPDGPSSVLPQVSDSSQSSTSSSSSSSTVSTSSSTSSFFSTSFSSSSSSSTSSSTSSRSTFSPSPSSSSSSSPPSPSSPSFSSSSSLTHAPLTTAARVPAPSPSSSDYPSSLNLQTSTTFVNGVLGPSESSADPSHKSFLDNKPVAGAVFALIGLVLVMVAIILMAIRSRKRGRDRLHNEAANISFDPKDVEERASNEKLRYSGSYSSHDDGFRSQTNFPGASAAMPNAVYIQRNYSNSRGVVNPGYNIIPGPYAAYGHPPYQSPRSPSPMYGAGAAGNGYNINNITPAAYAPQRQLSLNDSATAAPPTKDMTTARIPPAAPLPDTFGDSDKYSGVTNLNLPRALRVANE